MIRFKLFLKWYRKLRLEYTFYQSVDWAIYNSKYFNIDGSIRQKGKDK